MNNLLMFQRDHANHERDLINRNRKQLSRTLSEANTNLQFAEEYIEKLTLRLQEVMVDKILSEEKLRALVEAISTGPDRQKFLRMVKEVEDAINNDQNYHQQVKEYVENLPLLSEEQQQENVIQQSHSL